MFKFHWQFLKKGFFVLSFKSYLYTLDTIFFFKYKYFEYFLPFCGLLFYFISGVFWRAGFNFEKPSIIFFFYSFCVLCPIWEMFTKSCRCFLLCFIYETYSFSFYINVCVILGIDFCNSRWVKGRYSFFLNANIQLFPILFV